MIQDKRLLGGAAAVAIVAALGGFGIARWTASEPAATEAASGNAAAPAEEEKAPDTVAMTAQAVQQADGERIAARRSDRDRPRRRRSHSAIEAAR